MKILGINFEQHDSGASLIVDGKILASVNEERFSRKKMDSRAPLASIRYCLDHANLKPQDIDIVALSGFRMPKKFFAFADYYWRQFALCGVKSLFFMMYTHDGKFKFNSGIIALLKNLLCLSGIPLFISTYLLKHKKVKQALKGFNGKFQWVNHHQCHMNCAYYTSGFDNCLSIVIEGSDWEDAMVIDEIKNGKSKRIAASKWPHSAGSFYELVTMILGFNPYLHAGKITGLAAYGNPDTVKEQINKLMWVQGLALRTNPLVYNLRNDYQKNKKIPDYFNQASKKDIAAAFQKRLEECVVEIIKKSLDRTDCRKIVLSGGVCANVRMNQEIKKIAGVQEIFVFPAMSDAGQALGAALTMANQVNDIKRPFKMKNVYLGPEYTKDMIVNALKDANLKFEETPEIEKSIAKLLSQGFVVARFNSRMEYGPRALGNRSVLFQTTDPSVNDWLNKKLKRTEFMPFAPASLFEENEKLYRNYIGSEYTAGFMTITFDCTEWMKANCPAVVHLDGTARPQLVQEHNNPSFYHIIKEYYKITGIPAIINTSFNIHGEPIVLTPRDAIKSFLEASLDWMAIDNLLLPHPSLKSRL